MTIVVDYQRNDVPRMVPAVTENQPEADSRPEQGPQVTSSESSIGLYRVASTTLCYLTTHGPQFIDITRDVARIVAGTGISDGVAVVYSRHTTAAIKINEHESLLLRDMERFLGAMVPQDGDYYHNDFTVRTENMVEDESPNGHSHCQHLLLSTSESIPVRDGKLHMGRWQRIFLIELDRARPREVVVKTMGC